MGTRTAQCPRGRGWGILEFMRTRTRTRTGYWNSLRGRGWGHLVLSSWGQFVLVRTVNNLNTNNALVSIDWSKIMESQLFQLWSNPHKMSLWPQFKCPHEDNDLFSWGRGQGGGHSHKNTTRTRTAWGHKNCCPRSSRTRTRGRGSHAWIWLTMTVSILPVACLRAW